MKSYDSEMRGTSRILVGFIFTLSAIVNVFIEDYQDYCINGLFLIIGICLLFWGKLAMDASQ